MTDYIHPMREQIDGLRRDLTRLELEFDCACLSEPRMTEQELSGLITRLAARQEQLERIVTDDLYDRHKQAGNFPEG